MTTSGTTDVTASVLHVATQYTSDSSLEKFWNIETVGITGQEDNAGNPILEQYINNSISREPNGSYVARFPCKKDHPPLPSN